MIRLYTHNFVIIWLCTVKVIRRKGDRCFIRNRKKSLSYTGCIKKLIKFEIALTVNFRLLYRARLRTSLGNWKLHTELPNLVAN